jgi:hypothetical protein
MNKIKRFLDNLYYFLISGKAQKRLDRMEAIQHSIVKEMLLLKYSEKAKNDEDLQMALDYLQRTGDFCMIPYERTGNGLKVNFGFDETHELPFVIHEGKRLYFPENWKEYRVAFTYADYIDSESLTGKGIKERSPHQYQSETFIVEDGDVLVDVGCAEALFALDVIEKVSKAYLIENDKQWYKPLELTFAPWKDKVVILHKTLSDNNSDDTVTLESIVSKEAGRTVFVKMDIEGGELPALQGAERFLKTTNQKLKLTACVYHRVNDAEMIEKLLRDCGYSTSFSSGYILTDFLDDSLLPTLRKGVIRAIKS